MILTNILQGKKYGVQTDSPISRDFLVFTIKLDCSDRNFPKNIMWKVALVSQNVQNFKKNSPKETRENLLLTLPFWLCWSHKYQEKPTILCERAQITTARIISARAVIKL